MVPGSRTEIQKVYACTCNVVIHLDSPLIGQLIAPRKNTFSEGWTNTTALHVPIRIYVAVKTGALLAKTAGRWFV